jgi:hypothetical protein
MNITLKKLHEVRDIIEAVMSASRTWYPATLCRAHRILELAIGDFFSEADDVAGFPDDPIGRERVGEVLPEPPFPAA